MYVKTRVSTRFWNLLQYAERFSQIAATDSLQRFAECKFLGCDGTRGVNHGSKYGLAASCSLQALEFPEGLLHGILVLNLISAQYTA